MSQGEFVGAFFWDGYKFYESFELDRLNQEFREYGGDRLGSSARCSRRQSRGCASEVLLQSWATKNSVREYPVQSHVPCGKPRREKHSTSTYSKLPPVKLCGHVTGHRLEATCHPAYFAPCAANLMGSSIAYGSASLQQLWPCAPSSHHRLPSLWPLAILTCCSGQQALPPCPSCLHPLAQR